MIVYRVNRCGTGNYKDLYVRTVFAKSFRQGQQYPNERIVAHRGRANTALFPLVQTRTIQNGEIHSTSQVSISPYSPLDENQSNWNDSLLISDIHHSLCSFERGPTKIDQSMCGDTHRYTIEWYSEFGHTNSDPDKWRAQFVICSSEARILRHI